MGQRRTPVGLRSPHPVPLSLGLRPLSERAARDAGSSRRLGCVAGPSQSPGIMSGVLPSLRDGWITVTSARAVARDFQFWRENVKPSPFHRRKTHMYTCEIHVCMYVKAPGKRPVISNKMPFLTFSQGSRPTAILGGGAQLPSEAVLWPSPVRAYPFCPY